MYQEPMRVKSNGGMRSCSSGYSYYQDRKERYKLYYLKRKQAQAEEERVGDYYYRYFKDKMWENKGTPLKPPFGETFFKSLDISNNETTVS
jgi:hypothetical protein